MSDEKITINIPGGEDKLPIDRVPTPLEEPEDHFDEPDEDLPLPNIPVVPVLDSEERKVHQSLVYQLRNYARSTFADRGVLADFNFNDLKYKSIPELELLLEDVKFAVSASNSLQLNKDMFVKLSYGFECTINKTGIADISGFTQRLMLTPNMDMYLEELALDMQKYTYVKPMYKVGYLAINSFMQSMNFNEQKSVFNESMNRSVSAEVVNLAKDL